MINFRKAKKKLGNKISQIKHINKTSSNFYFRQINAFPKCRDLENMHENIFFFHLEAISSVLILLKYNFDLAILIWLFMRFLTASETFYDDDDDERNSINFYFNVKI